MLKVPYFPPLSAAVKIAIACVQIWLLTLLRIPFPVASKVQLYDCQRGHDFFFLYLVASAQISLVSQVFSFHVSYHVPTDDSGLILPFPDIFLVTCDLLKTSIGITHEFLSA